jgi:hypothetical protein
MVKLDDTWFHDPEDRHLIAAIEEYLSDQHLGRWTGQSSGAGAMDVTFAVTNKRTVAQQLDAYLHKRFATRSYYISDRYELLFERGVHDT